MTPTPAASDAIGAALIQDWKKAIAINQAIIKTDKSDIDALSRLGFAYLKNGQFKEAKRIYQKVLAIDQYNQIATKNLKKLASMRKKDVTNESPYIMSPMIFLEEPGKTKIIECVHVAPSTVLSLLSAGQEVQMKVKNHCVEIRTSDTYIAALPDDMSFKLNKMIAGGNTYQAIIKSIDKKSVKVLVRELSRGKRFAKQPSFTSTTSYISFAKGGNPRESLDGHSEPTENDEAPSDDDTNE